MVESGTRKSVLDEILEGWFAELENVQGFDTKTIERLRRLAAKRRLGRPAEVRKAIELGERRAR
jgi:hypothetical protein